MLLIRNQIYYFEWQVPLLLRPFLGQTEIIKSFRRKIKSVVLYKCILSFIVVMGIDKASETGLGSVYRIEGGEITVS